MKIGDKAPDFETTDEMGNPFRLSDHLGSKIVVYFYPKDDTPGCTAEACSIRDNYDVFEDAGVPIVGISGGSRESHQKFKAKHSINFPLLMDEDYSIAKLYGVYKPIKILGRELLGVKRLTFLIDEQGNIQSIFGGEEGVERVKTGHHAQQIIEQWGLKL